MITTVVADGKNEYEFIDLLKKRAQNSDKNVRLFRKSSKM